MVLAPAISHASPMQLPLQSTRSPSRISCASTIPLPLQSPQVSGHPSSSRSDIGASTVVGTASATPPGTIHCSDASAPPPPS